MRRTAGLLALAALLAVAGCSGLVGDGEESHTETVTPAPVPTSEAAAGPERVAPGLTAEELVDADALVASHGAILANTTYTRRRRVTRRYENGTLQGQYVSVVQRNDTAIRYWYNRTGDRGRRVDRFATDERVYTAVTRANGTVYQVTDVGSRARAARLGAVDDTTSLRRAFRTLSVETDGTVERDGRTLYRLRSTDSRDVLPIRNVSFVGYVTPEGLVTEYRISYTVERDPPIRVEVVASLEAVGETSVERPTWLGEAANASG